jgi:hypothetical protein
MAEALVGELRLALAQVDRHRQNAQAQVGSHASLLELLEDDRIEEAVEGLEHHLAGAEIAIIDRLRLEDP